MERTARWRPSDERPEVLDERIAWRPLDDAAPMVIELDPLFREVLGDGRRSPPALRDPSRSFWFEDGNLF